jgi:hypothetical protein
MSASPAPAGTGRSICSTASPLRLLDACNRIARIVPMVVVGCACPQFSLQPLFDFETFAAPRAERLADPELTE